MAREPFEVSLLAAAVAGAADRGEGLGGEGLLGHVREEPPRVEVDGVVICQGMRVSIMGEDGSYEFLDTTVRDADGTMYFWLVGRSGDYESAYRAIHPDRLDIEGL